MRFNEHIAISAPKVLLVPYDAHHVPHYHTWMEDAAIREATASDRLTLEEEYENQISWRTSADKLTFIVCKPLDGSSGPAEVVVAGDADRDERMVGDINLFLTPWDDDNYDEEGASADNKAGGAQSNGSIEHRSPEQKYCVGEVDIMIANEADRGKGMGRAAVSAFLWFIKKNVSRIVAEYAASTGDSGSPELRELLVRIKSTNDGSMALFRGLGFAQRGDVNYFGEIEMVLKDFNSCEGFDEFVGHREVRFDRSKLTK
ncbi:putative GNAT domain-containing protein [Seiridium unicorne]|uniref:GNAT domain-containing protein n=1 Tax=Seiridium unicorne TaxID=138068 RepID=A0ABR2VHX7_9PEZI